MMLKELLEYIKTAMPWLTGGLGGAVLTATITSWRGRRIQPRLLLRETRLNYTLPHGDEAFGELKVFYRERPYKELSFCEFELRNSSPDQVITENPIIVSLGTESEIIEKEIVGSLDTNPSIMPDQDRLSRGDHRFQLGRLLPGDWVRGRLLVINASNFRVAYRGDPKVKVLKSTVAQMEPLLKDLRWLGTLLASYIVIPGLDIVSPVLRGIVVLIAIPSFVRVILAWRAAMLEAESTRPQSTINVAGNIHDSLLVAARDSGFPQKFQRAEEAKAETRGT